VKTYTIIGGVNGVGKSSLTGVLKISHDLGRIIDVDMLADVFKIDSFEAGKRAIAIINDCLKNGMSFAQETTLSGHKILDIVLKARKAGYFIRIFYIGLETVDECFWRIENRVTKGGHYISRNDILRRFNNRFSSLLRVLPYCDEAIFFDNQNGFKKVAEYIKGQIHILEMSMWMSELAKVMEQKLNYTCVSNNLPIWWRS
jgi:predicted ABC-type ATPase